MERRQRELEDIKKVTSQIREISNEMGLKLKDQALIIGKLAIKIKKDDLDNNINMVRENVSKVDNELSKISNKERKMRVFDKKTMFFIILIVVVIIIIMLFIVNIF